MVSMASRRSQSNIVSWLLLTAISLTLIAGIYFWAWPNLQKAQNMDEVFRLENRMLELHTAIKKAANEQTQMAVPFYIKKGTLWLDENNSIRYTGHFKLDRPYPKRVIFGNSTGLGSLGRDEPGFLEEWGAIEFRLHYIFMLEPGTNQEYIIKLERGDQTTIGRGDHYVFVKWIGENTSYPNIDDGFLATAQLIEINML